MQSMLFSGAKRRGTRKSVIINDFPASCFLLQNSCVRAYVVVVAAAVAVVVLVVFDIGV